MAAEKGQLVPRPPKKNEYEIRFATANAQRSWRDPVATLRNPMAETWDFLTRTPTSTTPSNYPLKGALGLVRHNGSLHERWQHKPTVKGSARIWFFVEERTVHVEQVHTGHPNETL